MGSHVSNNFDAASQCRTRKFCAIYKMENTFLKPIQCSTLIKRFKQCILIFKIIFPYTYHAFGHQARELFEDLIDGPIVVPNPLGPVDCRVLHVTLGLWLRGWELFLNHYLSCDARSSDMVHSVKKNKVVSHWNMIVLLHQIIILLNNYLVW